MRQAVNSLLLSWGRMAYWDGSTRARPPRAADAARGPRDGTADSGAGSPTLVFLHGTGCDSADWQEVLDRLPAGMRTVCMDFRGHGGSSVPSSAFTLEDLAGDVIELRRRLDLHAAVLVGHSLGGMVAMAAAARCQEIAGLLLLEGWTRLAASAAFTGERFYGRLPPEAVRQIRQKAEATRRRFAAAVWDPFWRSVETFDASPWLARAEIPVLDVYGAMGRDGHTEDRLLIPKNPRILLRWVDDAGHYLPHECPREVARLCVEAAASVGGQGAGLRAGVDEARACDPRTRQA